MKIRVGDVFSIPINNGNFGIGQILKKENPKSNVNGFLVLFEKELIKSDLGEIDYEYLEDMPVLLGMPLDMLKMWRKDKPWKILGNTTPVYYPIPMFKLWSPDNLEQSVEESTYLVDFGLNFYRPAKLDELKRVARYFTGPGDYFESLLNTRFVNAEVDRMSDHYENFWPTNLITEEDMVTNAHLYNRWKDFGLHEQ
jgi:hypothetical protein